MKRVVLVVLLLSSAALLFARGNVPDRDSVTPFGARGAGIAVEAGEPVTVTGTLGIVDDHIVLMADGETWSLGIPRAGWYLDQVPEGATVTVEGYMQDEPVADGIDGPHIVARAITRNGEALDLGLGQTGFGARGPAGVARGAGRGLPIADDESVGLRRGYAGGRVDA